MSVVASGKDGLWRSGYEHAKDPQLQLWVRFAATRVFKRFGLWTPAR